MCSNGTNLLSIRRDLDEIVFSGVTVCVGGECAIFDFDGCKRRYV